MKRAWLVLSVAVLVSFVLGFVSRAWIFPAPADQHDAIEQSKIAYDALVRKNGRIEADLLTAQKKAAIFLGVFAEYRERCDAISENAKELVGMVNAMPRSINTAAVRSAPAPLPRYEEPTPQPARSAYNPPPPPASTDRGIIQQCETKWGSKADMVTYCEKQQEEAKAKLADRTWWKLAPDVPAGAFNTIRGQCQGKWSGNYEMQDYCESEEISAYRAANHH